MVLQMARPHKNPKTGVFYFRQKTPADVRKAFGKAEVSRSLGTKDEDEAKVRYAVEVQKQSMIWQSLRAESASLPHKQIMTLVCAYYRDLNLIVEDEPGSPRVWRTMLEKLDVAEPPEDALRRFFSEDADRLLSENGLAADGYSHTRLCTEMHKVWVQWATYQLRRSDGDYRPDPNADRFPEVPPKKAPQRQPKETRGITLEALFKLWERDHLANGKPKKTADDFRQKINDLRAFLGHENANEITGANISDWCDHLRHEKELAARTVRDKYLAAAKAVFGAGVGRRKVSVNPADGVKVSVPKRQKTRSPGFTDAEAKAILMATLRDPETLGGMDERNKMAIRWVPWICAYTGARVSEITQLRREDLIEENGISCIRITPEAGSVKTGAYRMVPLHPHLLEMGLKTFIQSSPEGPLFYESKRPGEDSVTRAKNTGKKVGYWVREVAGVTDKGVWPNHGWRHRFKTVARDVDIPPEYSDALTGHQDGRASTSYGETTVKALWREVQKLPRYRIP
ncbi:DUF6538 domain-containing protein [Jannaschia sp. 2305UL9-9]|uniref:DUF6538 domain-containing protein n=1 Tax=Jannaschia sp. 2305UL9-9 TaxID=3121638 RepID=UPI003527DCA2